MTLLRLLTSLFLARDYHSVSPTTARWRPAPGSGRYGPECFCMFPSTPCPIWLAGSQIVAYLPNFYPPTTTNSTDNTSSVKWNCLSMQASIYFTFLRRSFWYNMHCRRLYSYDVASVLTTRTLKTHTLKRDQQPRTPVSIQRLEMT